MRYLFFILVALNLIFWLYALSAGHQTSNEMIKSQGNLGNIKVLDEKEARRSKN